MNSEQPDDIIFNSIAEVNQELKIQLRVCQVYASKTRQPMNRFFFTIAHGVREDNIANNIAEGILLLTELFYGPLYDILYDSVALPFKIDDSYKRLSISTLEKKIAAPIDSMNRIKLLEYLSIPDLIVALSIKALPVIIRNNQLYLSVAFIAHAQRDFYVYPGQLEEALYEGDWIPTRYSEIARWESAFQNSYKAIEAIIGDPPKNESKFESCLIRAGLNPNEKVGYRKKTKISEVIREMNWMRDTHVAHGSTPNRGIKMFQMVEFQECARYVIKATIEHRYGKEFYTTKIRGADPAIGQ